MPRDNIARKSGESGIILAKMAHLDVVDTPMMVTHFGLANDRPDVEKQSAVMVKSYNSIGKIAEKHNVRVLIEVAHRYGFLSPLERVNEWWIGWYVQMLVCLLTRAIGKLSAMILMSCTKSSASVFAHIPLRDSAGCADGEYDLELTPGEGEVDFKRRANIIDKIDANIKIDYQGDVTTEFEYRDVTLEHIENKYKQGLIHLKNSGWPLPETVISHICP